MKVNYSIFSAFGIEIEYMIVCQKNLNINPVAEYLLTTVGGKGATEVEMGPLCWSNELVAHVIELKTNGPTRNLSQLPALFQNDIQKINKLLAVKDSYLLPSGAHPFMDPHTETKLWQAEDGEIYQTYDKIFSCKGHGWSNLQSVHLNLPFADDNEFAKLHTAIRLLLPILPAVTASTPILDLKATGYKDTRLMFYAQNQQTIPSICGEIVPEPITTKKQYKEEILGRMYNDIAKYDPKKILQYEWLNSRGAIARFDRNSIEIRTIDTQEAPIVDLAIAGLVVAILKAQVAEKWLPYAEQLAFSTDDLSKIFFASIKGGMTTNISNAKYLQAFGFSKKSEATARELWQHIMEALIKGGYFSHNNFIEIINNILIHGNLAERILKHLGRSLDKNSIIAIYRQLANCLQNNQMFGLSNVKH